MHLDFFQWHRTVVELHETILYIGRLVSWLLIHRP